jgi:peptidylprolyl isomerase
MVAEESRGEEKQNQESAAAETVSAGSFVLIDYVIKTRESGELVDTSIEEEARKAGVTDTTRTYEPRLSIVGRGFILKAIEDELVGMPVGGYKSFEIPPEKAFGERDPSKVKVIPLRKFKDVEQPIGVGSKVIINGREGYIRSIGSGRVQVDFNHYLAGKTLLCDIWVRKIITDDVEKIYSLLHSRIPEANRENTTIILEKPTVTIKLSKDLYLLSGLQMVKQVVAREVMELIPNVEKVVFVEEYEKESRTREEKTSQ